MAEPGSHDPFGRPTAPGSRDAFGRPARDAAEDGLPLPATVGGPPSPPPAPPDGRRRRPWRVPIACAVVGLVAGGAVVLAGDDGAESTVAARPPVAARPADATRATAVAHPAPGDAGWPRDPAARPAPPLPAGERRRDDRRAPLLAAADRRPVRARPPLRSFLRRDDLARALSLLQRRVGAGERVAELAVWSDVATLLACGPRDRARYYTAGVENPVAVSRGGPTPIATCATVPDRAPTIDPGAPARLRLALRRGGLAERRIASISYIGPDGVDREPFWVVHATRRGLAWIAGADGRRLRRAPSWLARRPPPRPQARRG